MNLMTPSELVNFVEANFDEPRPDLLKQFPTIMKKQALVESERPGSQEVVKIMGDVVSVHLSSHEWCSAHVNDIQKIFDLFHDHQCLAQVWFDGFVAKTKMQSLFSTFRNSDGGDGGGGDGGVGPCASSSSSSRCGGCPKW